MKPGEIVWIRAKVVAITPNAAVLVLLDGPKGTTPQAIIDPNAPTVPGYRSPEPIDPTASL